MKGKLDLDHGSAIQELKVSGVDALDEELQNAATEAELKRRGAGVDRILRELAVRNVLP